MSQAEKIWDRLAKNYDREEMDSEPVTLKIIGKIRKYLEPQDLVLDFGCGTGVISNEIAGEVQGVHALDISSNMLEIAKRKADERDIVNVEYIKGTLYDDRFQGDSYEVIVASYMLHLVGDPAKVIQKFHELLKPGGYLITATPCMKAKPLQWLLLTIVSLVGMVPRVRYFNRSQLEELITAGNFELIETEWLDEGEEQYFIAARKN